jgi:3-dehydroquinate synthase
MKEPTAQVTPLPQFQRVHQQRFTVDYDYPVYFTERVFGIDNAAFCEALSRKEPGKRHRFMVFVDENVAAYRPDLLSDIAAYAQHYGQKLELVAPPETVPGGEAVKNDPQLVERLQRRLLELGIDRHSYVVAVGGGAVLDLIGYVAGTTHRGVRHVRVPTTVLAQNDSGVGVKNGVNAFGMKNFLGTFAPPFAVLNDIEFLTALEPRDKIAGMAEAVKVSLIRDAVFFAWLEAHADELVAFQPQAMAYMIRRCAELHMRQIAHGGDPFESGSARPLDYGHWAAHKLEVLTHHSLRHGEAVAIGLALDSRYSVQVGWLAPGEEVRICALLEKLGFRLWHPMLEKRHDDGNLVVLAGLRDFREHLGGELTVTLLRDIGVGEEVHEMHEGEIRKAIAWLKHRLERR